MKDFLDTLAILIPSPSYRAHRAAMHLVAAEVVKANPTPPPRPTVDANFGCGNSYCGI